jgi:hypothetical protein
VPDSPIERDLSSAERLVADWQREFGDLNRIVSTFVVEAESRLTIILDTCSDPFTRAGVDEFLESASSGILDNGNSAVDALADAMHLVEKVQKSLDQARSRAIADQVNIRVNALMERISHGQLATHQSLSEATEVFSAFALDAETIHEIRIARVMDRLAELPWKQRATGPFDTSSEFDGDIDDHFSDGTA